jgi:hypothetical protein
MKYTYIYILIDPVFNQIRYVGKANNPNERYKNHKNRCRDKNTHKRNWINKLKLKGFNPEIEIIDKILLSEWHYWEKFWISYYKFLGCDLINYTSGGDGLTFGNKTSFKKGQTSWNKGSGHKQKCLECGIEFNISPSQSKKRLCCTRKCSVIYRKKNNLYNGTFKKNYISWNKGKKGIKLKPDKNIHQYCPNTGVYIKTWNTAKEAGIKLNINFKSIGQCARGKSKSAGKYIWSYTLFNKIEIKNNRKLKIKI